MRILIAGVGRVGLNVAAHLRGLGHEVTVVDRDAAVVQRAFEHHGLVALAGDATEAALLRTAEVERAEVVVAMLRRDADNLAVALLAKAAGVERIMVRMRDTEYRRVYLDNGVDRVLSEIEVLLGAFVPAIEHEEIRNSMLLGTGESMAFELPLPEGAAVVGRRVSDIASDPAYPPSCVFAGLVSPNAGLSRPHGGSVIEPGVTLLLVARRDELAPTIEFFTRRRTEQ